MLRYLLKQRKRLYDYLFSSWNYIEKEILNQRYEKKQKKLLKKSLFHTSFSVNSWVPDHVKMVYIRDKVKVIIQDYLQELRNYYEINFQDNSPTLEPSVVLYSKPACPNLRKEFTREVFRIMIENTLKEYEKRKVVKK